MAASDIFHILGALMLLLVAAHTGGWLAERIGLPPMVGELAGGILLGPTLLHGTWGNWLGDPGSPSVSVIAFFAQLGLLLLMFTAGLQMRTLVSRTDARTVGWVAGLGVLVPVATGIVLLQVVDLSRYHGPAGSGPAFALIACAALAVTSIPVITRIFIDLDLLGTRLARIVLCVAVLEDVLLYVAVSLALGMVDAGSAGDVSIPVFLGIEPGSAPFVAWHVVASVLLLAAAANGSRVQRALGRGPLGRGRVSLRNPVGWTIAWMLGVTMLAMLLGLAPMFGALIAGMSASRDRRPEFVAAHGQITAMAAGVFIPIYFASIGLGLDLVASFDWKLTLGLLLVGSAVKVGGSLVGALVAGEQPIVARAMAVSVNARGGPGIVLATTAFAAGIVDRAAFTSLIVLAIVTSVAAGMWLARLTRGRGFRPAVAASARAVPRYS